MKGHRKLDPTYHIKDTKRDILSHPGRENKIHILTLDSTLATDVYERIHRHPGMKTYQLVKPQETKVKDILTEIEDMVLDTTTSRLLVMDVRKATRARLQSTYNTIVGYNRRDFNKLCYTIVIGDGPVSLFQAGKFLDVFIPHLSTHRVDYHPAVFFYDPFLHYEPDETQLQAIHEEFVLSDKIPKRFDSYFNEDQDVRVGKIRRYFRAIGKPDQIREKRLRELIRLYKKRIAKQFPHHKDQLEAWLSREGVRLASEKLHLYPLFFEDWVFHLVKKAMRSKA